MSSIISVENLSKRYIIGHQRDASDGLRHRLEDAFRHPFRRLRSVFRARTSDLRPRATREEFWALKDVSFEVKQGEVIGIIGRNGAGKSTLLKLLSRITEPTEGRIRLKGRVASLLEVGTGFHQELTGRENIFLNGAILGMSRSEIKRKFDEIVAFSEVEKFLDTPVKRYSSGMYVRLAFAVAAHLEPEILIVDEVLAVGDNEFQKKCLGKMGEVARGGRTVLFVSHNMASIRQLCTLGLLLSEGRVHAAGEIEDVVGNYLSVEAICDGQWRRLDPLPQEHGIYFEKVSILSSANIPTGHLDNTRGFTIEIRVHSAKSYNKGQIALRFTNQEGVVVLTTCSTDRHGRYESIGPGKYCYRIQVPGALLAPGVYALQIAAHIPGVQLFDLIDNTISICIEDVGSLRSLLGDHRLGVIEPVFEWTCTEGPIADTNCEVLRAER
jgi:lipopolysaccharide transport system ATP-binding protein